MSASRTPLVLALLAVALVGAAAGVAWLAGGPSAAVAGGPLAPEAPGAVAPRASVDAGPTRREAVDLAAAPRATRDEAPRAPEAAVEITRVTVRAVDATTGTAVGAFWVRALPVGLNAQGRNGVAELEGVPSGPLTLEVQGPEHGLATHVLDVPEERTVILRLPQLPGLRGVVRHADARPAANVALRLVDVPVALEAGASVVPTPPPDVPRPTLAKTDEEGRYRFAPLPAGRYRVEVELFGRTVAELGPSDVGAGLVDLPDVRLEAGTRLELEVADGAGRPGAQVLVVLMGPDGSTQRRYTDHEGKLALEPLASGRYTVILAAEAGRPEQRRELVLAGGLHRESFRVDAASGTQPTGPGQ